jgi:MFS family permease
MIIKKIFPLFFIQLFLLGIGGSIVGPLIPILASSFKVSLDIIGSSLSLNAFGILLASLFSGIISERFGKRNISILGNILFIISFLGLYFSSQFSYFTICYIIFGISWGIILVNSFSIISDVSQLNKSKAIIRLFSGYILGASFGPILISGILFFNIDWRYLFLSLALINIIILIILLVFKIEGFSKKRNEVNFINLLIKNRNLLSNPINILCGVFVFLNYGIGFSFAAWFTTYFKNLNVQVTISSMILALYFLFAVLGSFTKSFLVAKLGERKLMLIFSILSFTFLFISFLIGQLISKIVFIFLFSFSLAGLSEAALSISIKQSPGYSGPITSIITSYGWIGVVIFQYTAGYLTENFSGGSLIYLSLVAVFLLIVSINILNFYYKNSRKVS